jgi:hypothetical protein
MQKQSDVFCVHSRLATKNTAKKQPPKQECAPGIHQAMKKEMTCFIIRCFFEQKKKFHKKK